MKLNPTTQKFVLHWGEMGSKWGVNRTVAQIHALLYIIGKPQGLKLVQTVHQLGDRRDYFTTSDDVWVLVKTIVEQRQQREIEPTLHFLNELIATPEFEQENEQVQKRIRDTQQFMDIATSWTKEMLKLPTGTLAQVLKLGTKIQRFLTGGKKD